uniref:Uncharacterized protein n=1 Tax=Haptolina brevifila TaxID=156173 RepID=A0A7S2N569_9EUKA|mmetsp:Transcript_66488/g.131825  ORF Transcript_66488/g.131825 Transcript_66488/m.131825 type:complete len:104 (+) Transcript_66488:102-413(+)|eukprot:CAMPEP_0174702754 /NCGR_PEP_ID=MMETSP1094-20130205/6932_1 /TAXON_ID=156173 /ORGANISM="Chrysochromulina brevifilum, Strain UTEX LB 985" /LENGTH=103 /DNA_ID=CAMNT_0015900569 /DNA_START=102 /DNA_END=413 /DNA_ORIENTATION=-
MINFQQPQPKTNKQLIRKVTQWVEDSLPESHDEATVMVNEMQCYEPGCAPLETVVSILATPSVVFKIFKPLADVQFDDVARGVQGALHGQQIPQHLGPAPMEQ